MDALLTIFAIVTLLTIFAALSVAFGVDSRDGFTDRPARLIFR